MITHIEATTAVRARLEDFVENALDPRAAAAACLAVADRHQPFLAHGMVLCEECSPVRDRYDDGTVLRRYLLAPWPCRTWTAIAEALGVEVPQTGDE
jgi:hypothetical protein